MNSLGFYIFLVLEAAFINGMIVIIVSSLFAIKEEQEKTNERLSGIKRILHDKRNM